MSKAKLIGVCGFLLLAIPTLGLAQKKTKVLPILNSISPTTATAGGGSFILTATGSRFTIGSVVRWNGSSRSTAYISSTQLQASISALDIATAGTAQVSVFTSGGSGGQSGYVTFTIAVAATPPPPPPPPPPSPSPLSITTTSVPGGKAGDTYTVNLAASGGTPAYVWSSVSGGGSLPPGLALQADGTIAGTPTQGGTFTFTTQASDQASQVAQKVLSITVEAPPPPTTTSTGGTIFFQTGFEKGIAGIWDYVNPGISVTAMGDHPDVAQIHYYLCSDSANAACGPSTESQDLSLNKYFGSANGYPNGLNEWYVRGYVYIKTPTGAQDLLSRKLLFINDDNGREGYNWSIFLLTFPNSGAHALSFATNGNAYVPAFAYDNLATLHYNTWYCLELHIKLDDPGQGNGIIQVWVDGNKVLDVVHPIRGSFTTGAAWFNLGRQAARSNYKLIDEYRYWDDIVISTSYVGPK